MIEVITFFCHSVIIMVGVGVILFLFVFFLSNSAGFEHEIPCDGISNGTHCLQNQTNDCFGYKENLLTEADKNYLISIHTSLRENLTKDDNEELPKAFIMKKLVWNDELAKMAQVWADSCNSTKKPPHLLPGDKPLGQLIITANESSSLEDLVGKWTEGLKYLNSEIISEYRKPNANEFDYEPVAQMIWWNTSLLGCGRSSYKLKNCDENVESCGVVELVCNYFPAGNNKGEPVYITNCTNRNNKTLTCKFDNKTMYCAGATEDEDPDEDLSESSEKIFNNRIKNKILELWPAYAGASSTWECWNARALYLLLLLTTFDLYGNILLRN